MIPPKLLPVWDQKVYDPSTCPLRLDPNPGALVVTIYHQLLRTTAEMSAGPVVEVRTSEGQPR